MAFTVGELEVKIKWSKTDQEKFANDVAAHINRIEKTLPKLDVQLRIDAPTKKSINDAVRATKLFISENKNPSITLDVDPVSKVKLNKVLSGVRTQIKESSNPVVQLDFDASTSKLAKSVSDTVKTYKDTTKNKSIDVLLNPKTSVASLRETLREMQRLLDTNPALITARPKTVIGVETASMAAIRQSLRETQAKISAANLKVNFGSDIGTSGESLFDMNPRKRFQIDGLYETYNFLRSLQLQTAPLSFALSGIFTTADVAAKGFSSTLKGIGLTMAGTTIGAGLLAAAVGGIAVAGISMSKDLSQTLVAYKTLVGDSTLATETFNDVLTMAKKTPFDVAELAKSGQRLIGARFDPKAVVDGLEAIGGVAASVGATGENVDRVSIALAKIAGRGKATMLELRSVDRNLPGFSSLRVLSEKLNIPLSEMPTKLRKGLIPAKEALDALVNGMKKFPGASEAMKAQVETLSGALQNIKDVFTVQFFKAFQPFEKELAGFIGNDFANILGSLVNNVASSIVPLAKTFIGVGQSLLPTIKTIIKPAVGFLQDMGSALEFVAESSVAAGLLFEDFVTIIGPGIKDFGKNISDGFITFFNEVSGVWVEFSDSFSNFLSSTAPLIQGLVRAFKPLIDIFGKAIDGVSTIMEAVSNPFFRGLDGVFETIAKLVDSIDFSSVADTLNSIVDAVAPLIVSLLPSMKNLFTGLQGILQGFASGISAAAPYIAEFFETISSFLSDNGEKFGELVGVLLVDFAQVLEVIAPILTTILELILDLPAPVLELVAGITALTLALSALGRSEGLYAFFKFTETISGKAVAKFGPEVKTFAQRLSATPIATTAAGSSAVGSTAAASAAASTASSGWVAGIMGVARAHPYLTAAVAATAAAVGVYSFTVGRANKSKQEFAANVLKTTQALRDEQGQLDLTSESLDNLLFGSKSRFFDLEKVSNDFNKLNISTSNISDNLLDGADGLERFKKEMGKGISNELFNNNNNFSFQDLEKQLKRSEKLSKKFVEAQKELIVSTSQEIESILVSSPEINIPGLGGTNKILGELEGLIAANAPAEDFKDLLDQINFALETSGDRGKVFAESMRRSIQNINSDVGTLKASLDTIVDFKLPKDLQDKLDVRRSANALRKLEQEIGAEGGLTAEDVEEALSGGIDNMKTIMDEAEIDVLSGLSNQLQTFASLYSSIIGETVVNGVKQGLSLDDIMAKVNIDVAGIQTQIDALPDGVVKDMLKKQFNPETVQANVKVKFNIDRTQALIDSPGFASAKDDPAFWATFFNIHPEVVAQFKFGQYPDVLKDAEAFQKVLAATTNGENGVEIKLDGFTQEQFDRTVQKYGPFIEQLKLFGDKNPLNIPVTLEKPTGLSLLRDEFKGWFNKATEETPVVLQQNAEAIQQVATQTNTFVAETSAQTQGVLQTVSTQTRDSLALLGEQVYNNWYDRVRGMVWLTETALLDIQFAFSSIFDGIILSTDYFVSSISSRFASMMDNIRPEFIELIELANTAINGTNAIASAVGSDISIPNIQVPVHHDGGVVGERGKTSDLSTKSDEVIAKLLVGERVLTREQAALVPDGTWDKFRSGSLDSFVTDLNELGYGVSKNAVSGLAYAGGNIFSGQTRSSNISRSVFDNDYASVVSDGVSGFKYTLPRLIGGALESLMRVVSEKIFSVFSPHVDLSGVTGAVVQNVVSHAGQAGNYNAVIDYMRATGVPFVPTSTFRPFSITASGNQSYHGMGRAVDFAGLSPSVDSQALANIFWALAPLNNIIPGGIKELIYAGPQVGENIKNGDWVAKYAQDLHHNHVHFAFENGALVNPVPGGLLARIAEGGSPEMVLPMGDAKYSRRVQLLDNSGVTGEVLNRYHMAQAQNLYNNKSEKNVTYNVTQQLPPVSDPGLFASAATYRLARL
jgi:tape measure domain-containing protein